MTYHEKVKNLLPMLTDEAISRIVRIFEPGLEEEANWVNDEEHVDDETELFAIYCSKCGYVPPIIKSTYGSVRLRSNYCPTCGCRMLNK